MLRLSSFIKKLLITVNVISVLLIAGCSKHDTANQILVGTISGPETQLMEVAKKVAWQRYGLNLKILEFRDYNIPNVALHDGSIDANACQHLPYLEATIKASHFNLVPVAKTFIYPMGAYSNKIKNFNQLQYNASIAIPNDPSNEARALLLLQQAGLITLKAGTNTTATPLNINSNPKHINFKEIDAAGLPRVLPDVTVAIINSNFAVAAGFSPVKDAIYLEAKDSPYANLIVARADNKNSPNMLKLIAAFQSPEVAAAAKKIFNGAAIQAW